MQINNQFLTKFNLPIYTNIMDYISSFLGYSSKEEKNTDLDNQLNEVDFTEKDINNLLT